MQQLVYASRATKPVRELELVILLVQARTYNVQHDITGSLVYGQGHFMQVLEGEPAALSALYARIQADPRHEAIRTLVHRPVDKRLFAEWSMAFRYLTPDQQVALAGFALPEHWAPGQRRANTVELPLLAQLRTLVLAGHGKW